MGNTLYINVPTKGRSSENIEKSKDLLLRTAEAVWNTKFDRVLCNFGPMEGEGGKAVVRKIMDDINLIAKSDYFISSGMAEEFDYDMERYARLAGIKVCNLGYGACRELDEFTDMKYLATTDTLY